MSRSDKRAQDFKQLAHQLKMTYTSTDEWGMMNLLESFHLFSHGRQKQISNVLYTSDAWNETKVYIFDYDFNQGKNRRKRQTVFFIKSKTLALPDFFMQPETFLHKIQAFLGYEDIDFAEHPKFSNQYYLKGEDPEWIRDTFNENIIRFFTVEKNWSLEGVGYYLILYRKNVRLSPNSIHSFYQKGLSIANGLTSKELGGLD